MVLAGPRKIRECSLEVKLTSLRSQPIRRVVSWRGMLFGRSHTIHQCRHLPKIGDETFEAFSPEALNQLL